LQLSNGKKKRCSPPGRRGKRGKKTVTKETRVGGNRGGKKKKSVTVHGYRGSWGIKS